MDNIGMQDSLLSRFDLLFIVLDQVSRAWLISEIICQYRSTCLYLLSKSSKQTSKTLDSQWFKLKGTL